GVVDPLVPELFEELVSDLHHRGQRVVMVDPNGRFELTRLADNDLVEFAAELDVALEGVEFSILRAAGFEPEGRTADLAECDLFRGLEPGELDVLASFLEERTVEPSVVLCRAGEPGDALFVVTGGSLDVVAPAVPGVTGSARIASISPGACVGEIAVIDGGSRSADVVATERSTVLTLSAESLARIEADRPEIYTRIMRNVLLMNLERLRRGAAHADRAG
ncbi:MAG: cyclic nucleotide-binding domain-containing protein, partial [Actinomycetota bacterium]